MASPHSQSRIEMAVKERKEIRHHKRRRKQYLKQRRRRLTRRGGRGGDRRAEETMIDIVPDIRARRRHLVMTRGRGPVHERAPNLPGIEPAPALRVFELSAGGNASCAPGASALSDRLKSLSIRARASWPGAPKISSSAESPGRCMNRVQLGESWRS